MPELLNPPTFAHATSRRVRAPESRKLPALLARTVTWDQGSELAQHSRFTIDTQVDVFFCDPASPWQRGTAENTVGLEPQGPSPQLTSGASRHVRLHASRTLNGHDYTVRSKASTAFRAPDDGHLLPSTRNLRVPSTSLSALG